MSVFCLVHGSTQSPEGWKLLVSALNARGHDCICVDLPIDEPHASAAKYAGTIAAALPSGCKPIVVGHSASGLFLPFLPDLASVARLVYLAAVIPLPGQSFLSQFKEHPEMYQLDFVGKDPTKDAALARQYLFHDCPPEVVPWALSTLRLMFAKEAILEACPLGNWPQVPCSYISCTEDRAINPDWWEAAALERLRTQAIRFKSGHAPHVSHPIELAQVLDSLAT